MGEGESVIESMYAFNTIIIKLLSMDIKITEEKCISLLYYFPDSWDSSIVDIGSNSATLKIDDVVTSLLSEDMR